MRGIVAKKMRRVAFGGRLTVDGKKETWTQLVMRVSQHGAPVTNKDGTESKTLMYAADCPRSAYRGMKRLWHVTPRAIRNKMAHDLNLSEFYTSKVF